MLWRRLGWPRRMTARLAAASMSALVRMRTVSSCWCDIRCASSRIRTGSLPRSATSAARAPADWRIRGPVWKRGWAPSAATMWSWVPRAPMAGAGRWMMVGRGGARAAAERLAAGQAGGDLKDGGLAAGAGQHPLLEGEQRVVPVDAGQGVAAAALDGDQAVAGQAGDPGGVIGEQFDGGDLAVQAGRVAAQVSQQDFPGQVPGGQGCHDISLSPSPSRSSRLPPWSPSLSLSLSSPVRAA